MLTDEAKLSDGETSKPAAQDAKLTTWESPSGPYVPLFSSRARVDEIARVRERAYGFIALAGKAAFARLAQEKQAAFLNPGFACGKQFVPDVIERLAGGEKAVPPAGAGDHTPGTRADRGRGRQAVRPWWKIW